MFLAFTFFLLADGAIQLRAAEGRRVGG